MVKSKVKTKLDEDFKLSVTETMRRQAEELLDEDDGLIQNISMVLKTVGDVAISLADAGEKDEADVVLEKIKDILAHSQEAKVHKAAMESVVNSYECPPTIKATNFENLISQKANGLKEERSFDPQTDQQYIQICRDMDRIKEDDEEEVVPDSADDDVVIENINNSIAPNNICPLSGKNIFELSDPMEDRLGFVYEKLLITRMVSAEPTNSVTCPVAGTSHIVKLRDLKPSRKVQRERKRMARVPSATRGNQFDIL